MNLVAGCDEDEGGEEDVEHRVVRDQDQYTVGVCTQPNMVLKIKIIYKLLDLFFFVSMVFVTRILFLTLS